MFSVLKQWVAVVAGGILAWPVATWALHALRTSDGRIGAPLSLAQPFLSAIAITLGAALAFAVISVVVGRVTNRYTGKYTYVRKRITQHKRSGNSTGTRNYS